MRHRERPPVGEQGRSPHYTPGAETPERVLTPRAAAAVWVGVVVLVAAYATVMTLESAGAQLPDVALWPLLFGAVVLVRWGLQGNSRVRPAVTRRQKVIAATLVVLAAIGNCGSVVALHLEHLRLSDPLMLIAFWAVIFGLVMTASVVSYRARFFA